MRNAAVMSLGVVAMAGIAAAAFAQGAAPAASPPLRVPTTVSVKDAAGPAPDATHIAITLPDKLEWAGPPQGEQTVKLLGDPNRAGPYVILVKWNPGYFSHPHFHDQSRIVYVVQGTWWVSASSHYDPLNTYPVPAGSRVENLVNAVHYDGARAGGPPVILEMVGMGPVKTFGVDENGKARPDGECGGTTPNPTNSFGCRTE